MSETEYTPLYNELREKIAFAAESQVLAFLDDKQLNNCVDSVYHKIEQMRIEHPGCELFFDAALSYNGELRFAVHHTMFGIIALREAKKVANNTMSIYDYFVSNRFDIDPEKMIKTRTYLQDNKIITEFL